MTPAPDRHQTGTADRQRNGNETAVLKCPKCGRTVATMPAAEAWCLPCGERMRPVKGKASA